MEPDRNHADWRTRILFKAGVKLCGPFTWKDRPDFTCFQAGNEMAQIARGARAELGDYANTQAKPEVGPFAAK